MTFIRRHARIALVALSCAVVGAGASAIASAGAATGSSAPPSAAHAHRAGGLRRFAARAVQGNVIVDTKHGFVTVSFERGRLDSVNGQQLTITEATRKATYKTVTVTVPATARVRVNRQKATLSDLKAGQRVLVLQAPQRTFVIARTAGTA